MENVNQTPAAAPAPSAEVKRPWQATLLGILNIIGLIGLALLTIAAFIGGSMLTSLVPVWGMLGGIGMALGFIFMAVWILVFFITRGIFKGQKWAIIVSIVFTALGLISAVMNISQMYVSLIVYAGMLYLEVVCLKDPYFNR
ncbi:MAG TPA: hypothetical protein PLB38_01230 [bacterium]|nr:hypothetical protein [bacterium]